MEGEPVDEKQEIYLLCECGDNKWNLVSSRKSCNLIRKMEGMEEGSPLTFCEVEC